MQIEGTQTPVRPKYEVCPLGSLHTGELMNLVCRQDCCKNKLICLICHYQKHQDHNVTVARRFLDKTIPSLQSFTQKLSLQSLSTLLLRHQQQALSSLNQIRNAFNESLDRITKQLQSQYTDYLQNYKLVKDITECDPKNITADLIEKITRAQSYVRVELETQLQVAERLFLKNKNKILEEVQTWPDRYQKKGAFSWVAHPKIQVTDMRVKSLGNAGYKYVLLDWTLANEKKVMKFKILQDKNNWVSIGIAHKNIVESKNFEFSYSNIGHGAYMVGSNGNSCSNTRADANNTIKSFKFSKGDSVIVVYDPAQKKVRFKKENSRNEKDQYSLDIAITEPNDLCFGAIFYYPDDELEFIPVAGGSTTA